MAAPDYVPPTFADQPRSSLPLPPPKPWTASRPADLKREQPRGRGLGSPGPDLGYAMLLAHRFEDRIRTVPGEDHHDVVAGCVVVAMRRASIFGRAPVVHDLELAFNLFGFLDDPASVPKDLLDWRRRAFAGAGHDYWDQRAIVDRIPDATLRSTPAQLKGRLSEWRTLVAP